MAEEGWGEAATVPRERRTWAPGRLQTTSTRLNPRCSSVLTNVPRSHCGQQSRSSREASDSPRGQHRGCAPAPGTAPGTREAPRFPPSVLQAWCLPASQWKQSVQPFATSVEDRKLSRFCG